MLVLRSFSEAVVAPARTALAHYPGTTLEGRALALFMSGSAIERTISVNHFMISKDSPPQ
jgi:hypothetical protein